MTLFLHFSNVLKDWLNTRQSISFVFLYPIGCYSYFGLYIRENQDLDMMIKTAIVF